MDFYLYRVNIYTLLAREELKGRFSSSIISRIAIVSVAVAIIFLLASFLILGAFKENIRDKVFAFDSHIKIEKNYVNTNFEEAPVSTVATFYKKWHELEGVKHMQVYVKKMGMLNHNDEVFGVLFKGFGQDFDRHEFTEGGYLKEGRFPDTTKTSYPEILISKDLASETSLKLQDTVKAVFLKFSPGKTTPLPRPQRYIVSGMYETGLDEVDKKLIFIDIEELQRINGWEKDQVSGFEVFVDDLDEIETINESLSEEVWPQMQTHSIIEDYKPIFDWFDLLNTNVQILISIIFGIACFNMISSMYILIMEKTNMVGTLKALGANDFQIAKIFWFKGNALVLKGLFWGNLIGLGVLALQYFFELIPLDPKNYYMHTVPVYWNWLIILGVNLFVVLFVNAVLFVPVFIVASMRPIKSIKFA